MLGTDATFRRADPEPVVAPAVPDRAVPLPAAVIIAHGAGEFRVGADEDIVQLHMDDDDGGGLFAHITPATARALAHWMTVFADAADAGEGA